MRHLLTLALVAGALATGTGCAKTYVVAMRQTDAPIGPDYILVQAQGNNPDKQKVFDCYSKPDGEDWKPTCVQVDFKRAAK